MKTHAVKTRALLLCLSIVAISAACDRREPEDVPNTAPDATTPTTPAAGTPPANPDTAAATTGTTTPTADDSLALGLLGAVNEHEIAAAKQAKEKKVSEPVMEFAQMMETQHSENQEKTESLGTPASTPEVQAMVDKGQKELDELGKKSGKEYETAYVEAMVKGHTEALSLIDTRLMTLASSEPVKTHLTETRDAVAKHLEEAKELQAEVAKTD
jgi:predicted outer membrane protein